MDDEDVVREITSCMMERLGYTVETAVDGGGGVDKYATAMKRGEPFLMTIMDLTIPGGMGGKEAVKELLAMDPAARVVVASGYSSDPVLADYARQGFRESLSKPFDLREIEDVIASMLKTP